MGNFNACVFLALSFWVPMLSPTVKGDRRLLVAAWMTLAFRHAIAFINAFVTPVSTTWFDLYRFHEMGAGRYHQAGQPYGEFLGVLYRTFGVSFWLGEEASILAYGLSLVLFVEIGVLLGVRNKLVGCVLLFGCMPSPAVHCSVTLRESYQVFGFLGSAYALLRLRAQSSPWAWPLLALSLFTMVIMHQGLAVFAVAVAALGVPWALQGRNHGTAVVGLLAFTLVPMFVPAMLEALKSDSATAQAFTGGRILNYAATYRDNVEGARSDYGVKIDQDTVVGFAMTASLATLMYFIAPLPWQVSSAMDFVAFFEVVMRVALIYGCVQQIAAANTESKQRFLLLLMMGMGLEFMWGLGTNNWGTAMRHHVVAFGALVLVGLPYYSSFTLDPALAGLLRRRERRKREPRNLL